MYENILNSFIDTDDEEVELKVEGVSALLLKADRGLISDIFTVRVNKSVFKKATQIGEVLAELPKVRELKLIAVRLSQPRWHDSNFITMMYMRKHA